MEEETTIVAIASAVGGGVGVLRLSGSCSLEIANKVWKGRKELAYQTRRQFLYGRIIDGDEAMAVYMPAPHSYTAEDVVEIQCHGGQFTVQDTLKKCLEAGANMAEAGEFTKRAFLNGRLDLTQAEAVGDLINAKSQKAMSFALRQLDGHLGNKIEDLYEQLTKIHAEIEVRLDFVEEDLDWTEKNKIKKLLFQVEEQVNKMILDSQNSQVLRNGVKVIIGGAPNVGKSSFLNYIVGYNRAIVTDLAGTTRDTIEEQVQIRGIPIRLVDTAGIRETEDVVEKSGIKRSLDILQEADFVFWLVDAGQSIAGQLPIELNDGKIIALINKKDLYKENQSLRCQISKYTKNIFEVSVLKEIGLEEVFDKFEKMVWHGGQEQSMEYSVNTRHKSLLELVLELLEDSYKLLDDEKWELLAINLKSTLYNLGSILGKSVQPDILNNIFSQYCIGK